MKFHVPDMSCGHCTAMIEKQIKTADPAATVAPDLETRMVQIGSTLDASTLQGLLQKAGYTATPA